MIGINLVFKIVYNFAHKKSDPHAALAQIIGKLSFAVRKAAETLEGQGRCNLRLF